MTKFSKLLTEHYQLFTAVEVSEAVDRTAQWTQREAIHEKSRTHPLSSAFIFNK